MKRLALCLALIACFLSAPAIAQPSVAASPRWKPPVANLAALPATGNTIGDTRVALDTMVHYTWDGDSWETAASGGGGGNSFETISTPAGTSPVADSATDTLTLACLGGLTCTGDSSTDTLTLAMGTASTATALAANGANCSAGQFPLGVDASGAVESCSTDISGNAATATALAANPADCSANQFANAIAASGALTCAAISDADVPDTITVDLAAAATALAANGANCSAGQYPLGVDASGAVESCTADDDQPDSDGEVPDAITVTGAVTGAAITLAQSTTPTPTAEGVVEWDTDDNNLAIGDGAATQIVYPGAHAGAVTDGGAATTATALAANGANCSAGQYPLGVDASGAVESCAADDDVPESGDFGNATDLDADGSVSADAVALGTDTTGNYVSSATASQGLTLTGTEGASLGLQACTDGQILKNSGGTSWACSADSSGAGYPGAGVPLSTGSSWGASYSVGLSASNIPQLDSTARLPLSTTPAGLLFKDGSSNNISGLQAANLGGISYLFFANNRTYTGSAWSSTGFLGTRAGASLQLQDNELHFYQFGASSNSNTDVFSVSSSKILTHNGSAIIIGSLSTGALFNSRLVEANTAGSGSPNILTSAESNTVLTNEGATAKNYHTLPTAVAGYVFTFYVQDTDGLRVTAAAGDTIRIGATVSSTAGYCESTTIGDTVTLVAINATEWVAVSYVGSGFSCSLIFLPLFPSRKRLLELAANDNHRARRAA